MTSVTKTWAFLLILLTTVLTTTAQYFLKTGLVQGISPTNYSFFIGMALYVVGAALMILAFKGGEVSSLYPVIASSYIWVALVSYFVFHESIHVVRWLGIAIIIAGVITIGLSGQKAAPEVL